MKNIIFGTVTCVLLALINPSFLIAQDQSSSSERFEKLHLEKINFSVGVGAGASNLQPLNERLDNLQIGNLESVFASAFYRISASILQGREFSIDIDQGATNGNGLMYDRDSFMSLSLFSMGLTYHEPIYLSDRFRWLFLVGIRQTRLEFNYNPDGNKSQSFNAMFQTQQPPLTAFHIFSDDNLCIPAGIRFQYRFGKKANLHRGGFLLGWESGYKYYFKTPPWREIGGRNFVTDMPTVKPDNFYFHVTFAAEIRLSAAAIK